MQWSFFPADSLLDQLAKGRLVAGHDFAGYHGRLAAVVDESRRRLLVSEAFPQLLLYPHQEAAVRRSIEELSGRAILADEVGLGKTVEAGAIMTEYMLRGLVKRALVLAPPGLLDQWREELLDRFGLNLTVPRGDKGWGEPLVLASLDTAKRERFAKEVLSRWWDIVIVDEAHRLRNISTAGWRFVYAIPRRFFLLLTATPIHNNLRELYSLVTLVMPGRLSTFNQFKAAFIESAQSPRNLPELRRQLGRVLIRASRRETLLSLPDRHAKTVRIEMSPQEREFYDGVVTLLRRAVGERHARKQLLSYVVLLREAASSVRAAVATLARMCGRRPSESAEAEAMRQLVELGRSSRSSAKVKALLAEVTGHDKTVVFTEYRATQDLIAAELRRQGIATVQFHGSMPGEERTRAVRAFRESARVLVSTEAGGEGQNWQFCSRIVNFDLPWNPMRVEQRIGRVHRIGQERQVEIINFATKGTIEEHVCDLLTDKIRLFESVLGELDVILARTAGRGVEAALTDLALSSPDDVAFASALESLGQVIERTRQEYERVQDWNDALLAGENEARPVGGEV